MHEAHGPEEGRHHGQGFRTAEPDAALQGRDVIVLSIPFSRVPELADAPDSPFRGSSWTVVAAGRPGVPVIEVPSGLLRPAG